MPTDTKSFLVSFSTTGPGAEFSSRSDEPPIEGLVGETITIRAATPTNGANASPAGSWSAEVVTRPEGAAADFDGHALVPDKSGRWQVRCTSAGMTAVQDFIVLPAEALTGARIENPDGSVTIRETHVTDANFSHRAPSTSVPAVPRPLAERRQILRHLVRKEYGGDCRSFDDATWAGLTPAHPLPSGVAYPHATPRLR